MTSPRRRAAIVAIIALVALVLLVVYAFFDPSKYFFPRCPFLMVTGWQCPGCGSQRAIHALLTGDFAAAWHYNAMFLILIPVIGLMLFSEAMRDRWPRLNRWLTSTAMVVVLVLLLAAWMVVRNLAQM